MRNAHLFIVDENTFPVVREKLVAGIGKTDTDDEGFRMSTDYTTTSQGAPEGKFWRGTLEDMYADISRMREGDLAFFYNQGDNQFYGIYELASEPYYSDERIETDKGALTPERSLRVNLRPFKVMDNGVAEKRALFDPTDPGELWVLVARKAAGQRSVLSIPESHASKLTRLLFKNNTETKEDMQIETPPSGDSIEMPMLVKSDSGVGSHRLRYEKRLEGWFMSNIDDEDNDVLRDVFGPVEELSWFANDVPYNSSGDAMDMITFHERENLAGEKEKYRYSVVELKQSGIGLDEVQQLEYYYDWAAKRLADGDHSMIQPILVGSYISDKAKEYLKSRKRIQERLSRDIYRNPIKIILYRVESENVVAEEEDGSELFRAENPRLELQETEEGKNYEWSD